MVRRTGNDPANVGENHASDPVELRLKILAVREGHDPSVSRVTGERLDHLGLRTKSGDRGGTPTRNLLLRRETLCALSYAVENGQRRSLVLPLRSQITHHV